MASRLARWFFLNFILALTPFLAIVGVRSLTNTLSWSRLENHVLEILFFALVTSITTIADLDEINEIINQNGILSWSRWLVWMLTLWMSILYGILLLETEADLKIVVYKSTIFWSTVASSMVLFVIGTVVQVVLIKLTTPPVKVP